MDISNIIPMNGNEAVTQTGSVAPPTEIIARTDTQAQTAAQAEVESSLSFKDTAELVADMNEAMDSLQTSIGFSFREDHNHMVIVEIKDRNTNELIKQIPSEELLAIKEKMEEFSGLLFDQSV